MRSSDYGVIQGIEARLGADVSLEMFRRMCLARHFDSCVVRAVRDGFVKSPVYLSLGQEAIGAAFSLALPDFQIFAQHRCHDIYLAFGGPPEKLRDELLGLPGGSSGGRAGSNCLQCFDNGMSMHGHHGLIGENVPLGVGAALGNGRNTVCFFGDGAAEEDYVFAAMGFAATHRLPVLFVCIDNNLSILTTVDVRRSWSITGVARALGMEAVDVADDPYTVYMKACGLAKGLPAFMNIYTCRAGWHVGVGCDGEPEWDRLKLVRERLAAAGLADRAEEIELREKRLMEGVWEKGLSPTR